MKMNEREQLEDILLACEAANFKHVERIAKLEELCKQIYACWDNYTSCKNCDYYDSKNAMRKCCDFGMCMKELGLLKGENNG